MLNTVCKAVFAVVIAAGWQLSGRCVRAILMAGHATMRGAALLMVLWLVLLAGLVAGYALTARTGPCRAMALRVNTLVAREAARAGSEYAAACWNRPCTALGGGWTCLQD